jgi:hypothetical protein
MQTGRESSAKIFINSADINTWRGSSTALSVPIQPFILRSDDPTHFVIGVESISIPLAIYVVNSNNNTLIINGTPYTIPQGNYTSTTLLATLNTLLPGFVWTFSTTTNKFTVTYGFPQFFDGTAQTLLGYISDGNARVSPYTLENTINLAYTTGVIVRLDNITTDNRCPSAGGGSGILARIPITVAPFKVLQYFNSQPFFTTIANKAIQSIDVSLLDDNYQPLVLVGDPVWSITLRIDYAEKNSKENQHTILANSTQSKLSSRNFI